MESLEFNQWEKRLSSKGVGAPHIRQRLYWVANSTFGNSQLERKAGSLETTWKADDRQVTVGRSTGSRVVKPDLQRLQTEISTEPSCIQKPDWSSNEQSAWLVNATGLRRQQPRQAKSLATQRQTHGQVEADEKGRQPWQLSGESEGLYRPSAWDDYKWLECRDGRYRRTQCGIYPLVDGFSTRVVNRTGQLRAYGNAITPPLAAEFIKAYIDVIKEMLLDDH